MRHLDHIDTRLLNLLQDSFPLAERPFAALGEQLEISEEATLRRIIALKQQPGAIIRQISAIFDSKSLGYESTLVAAKVAPHRLDIAAGIINRHPGVSHNYKRENEYNLWYTLAVPPDSQLGLAKTVQLLHEQSGAIATRLLPTLRMFKIGVRFDLSGKSEESPRKHSPAHRVVYSDDRTAPSELQIRMIRTLQCDLPLITHPFEELAIRYGVSTTELLTAAQSFLDKKWMRRFAAVLHHREAGFDSNAMGVWQVPHDKIESFGQLAATFPAVSHCYLRPSYADWPFNLFTMVHATNPQDSQKVLAQISAASGITEYTSLFSTKEYKKVRVQYFTPEIAEWEQAATHEHDTVTAH